MRYWLNSAIVAERSTQEGWPTERGRQAWLQFYEAERRPVRREWTRKTEVVRVNWTKGKTPPPGDSVIVEPLVGEVGVFSPDYRLLGLLSVH